MFKVGRWWMKASAMDVWARTRCNVLSSVTVVSCPPLVFYLHSVFVFVFEFRLVCICICIHVQCPQKVRAECTLLLALSYVVSCPPVVLQFVAISQPVFFFFSSCSGNHLSSGHPATFWRWQYRRCIWYFGKCIWYLGLWIWWDWYLVQNSWMGRPLEVLVQMAKNHWVSCMYWYRSDNFAQGRETQTNRASFSCYMGFCLGSA